MFSLASVMLQKLFEFSATLTPGANCTQAQVGSPNFFFIPHWWEYIKTFQVDALGQCQPNYSFPDSIFPIGLALLDIMLRIVGFAAVIMIMVAGIKYIIAQGNSEQAAGARRALYYALVGLGIAFTASLIVAFVGNVVKT